MTGENEMENEMENDKTSNGNGILYDWLEFKCCEYAQQTDDNWHYVNLRRNEISEVLQFDKREHKRDECEIIMKNGNAYVVQCPYDDVMKMV